MMYHLKALIAAHRAKLAVAALGYALYSAIDPASSAHAGFAVAAVILMGVFVVVPAMLLAAHVDRVKPGKVEKPFKPVYVSTHSHTPALMNRRHEIGDASGFYDGAYGANISGLHDVSNIRMY